MTTIQTRRTLFRRLRLWIYHRLYKELAWAYNTISWVVSFGQWADWRRVALDYRQGERVLEAGFGTGELLVAAKGQGISIIGLEPSTTMQKIAMAKLAKSGLRVPLASGTIEHMPFMDAVFDCVLITFPAEFILEAETWIELWRVLRPGGRVVVVGIVVEMIHPLQKMLAHAIPGGKPSREWYHCIDEAERAGLHVSTESRMIGWSRVPVLIAERKG